MNLQSNSRSNHAGRARWLVPAALLLILAGAFLTRTAFARIMVNTIDPVGIVAGQGRHVTVTGPIGMGDGTVFLAGETAHLRVTVTQRSTGALAEGCALLTSTGALQQWEVETVAEGRASFEPGPATAVAMVRTTIGGQPTDAHQWLVKITLVKE